MDVGKEDMQSTHIPSGTWQHYNPVCLLRARGTWSVQWQRDRGRGGDANASALDSGPPRTPLTWEERGEK